MRAPKTGGQGGLGNPCEDYGQPGPDQGSIQPADGSKANHAWNCTRGYMYINKSGYHFSLRMSDEGPKTGGQGGQGNPCEDYELAGPDQGPVQQTYGSIANHTQNPKE